MKLFAILAVVALCGCSTTNISDMVKALGQDTNSVTVDVTSVWATIHITRNVRQIP